MHACRCVLSGDRGPARVLDNVACCRNIDPCVRRNGRLVLSLALCASFVFYPCIGKTRRTRPRIHQTHCLRRVDVAFFRSRVKLRGAYWSTAQRVEVRFSGSRGAQLRKGAVDSGVRAGSPRPLGAGGGAVDPIIELVSCYLFLPLSTARWYLADEVTDVPRGGRSNPW